MSAPVQPNNQPKLIYFADRRPQMDADAFRLRWREHARLGMSMPRWRNIRRYVHCDAVSIAGTGLPAEQHDGIAMIWYRDEARRLDHVSDDSAAPVMKRDELETFSRPVREAALLADEFTLEADSGAAYRLFLKIRRRPGIGLEAFRSWWLEDGGSELRRRLLATNTVSGYIQNHARLAQTELSPPAICDCIDEIACDDTESCEAALLRAFAELPGVDRHIGAYRATWTVATVLHDVP